MTKVKIEKTGKTVLSIVKYVLPLTFYITWVLYFLYLLPSSVIFPSALVTLISTLYLFRNPLYTWLKKWPTLTSVVFLFTFFVTLWMYLKYLSFEVYAFDLGTFQQSLYTTVFSHRWFLDNPDMATFYGTHPEGYVSIWNILFSPFMLLLLPEYALFPSPVTLFFIQALAISSSSILLREVSTGWLGESKARVLSYLWFAYPFTYFSGFYDFHLESFIPFFTFLTLLSIQRGGRLFRASSLVVYLTIIKATPFLMIALLPWLYRKKLIGKNVVAYMFTSIFFAFFDVIMERIPYDGKLTHFYVLGVKVPLLSESYVFHYIPILLYHLAPQLGVTILSWFVGVLFLPCFPCQSSCLGMDGWSSSRETCFT
ncbi:DUF2079 domain-containing protein [Sulfuracidifex tepidarius]|uniref:DUF2079 domain-containing protein n=1 Tax=Sulfuracidifex tepidarius TaxID=1294262 RepID=UPI0006D012F3|nr:DUF2079 domain-containing protein [Sulfuracidifex tepidarius]